MQRAVACERSDLVGNRTTDQNEKGSDVLTDDFAPVNLYETVPLRPQKHG